nr:F0F1 ATP synthase subunit epsilon [uncultured Pseudodesulfovibrio sp.]
MMNLKILLPSKIFLDESVEKITGESPMGGFTLKPRHIDMTTAITPGIMSYTYGGGETVHLAVDRGVAVKCGNTVTLAVRNAVRGELGELERAVREMLRVSSERERTARTAVARLEADFVRRLLEFGK